MALIHILDSTSLTSTLSFVTCSGTIKSTLAEPLCRRILVTSGTSLLQIGLSSLSTGAFSLMVQALPGQDLAIEAVGIDGENNVVFAHCKGV